MPSSICDLVLLAVPQPVEVVHRRQHRDVPVARPRLGELPGGAGEQQLVERAAPGRAQPLGLLLGHLAGGRLPAAALERLGAERLRPATRRVAQLAVEEADDRVRDVELAGVVRELGRVGADRHEVQGQVAHDLRGRGHLHDVAEDVVRRGVHVLDLLELLAEAERDRLLAQVGELPARDLVGVDAAGRRRQPRLERRVDAPRGLPVGLQRADGLQRQPGLPVGVVGRRDQRRERRLRGRAGHRRGGRVDRVHPGVDRGEQGRQLAARGVVRVQVHRQVEPVPQRGHQGPGGRRAQQPGHVLDRQDVRPGVDDPLGQPQVVVQRVELLPGVGQVAGVAERHLGDRRPGAAHRLDRRPHLLDVVERVEDPEDVDAGRRGLLDERVRDVGGVRRVADGVAAAEQHLEADVRAPPGAGTPAAPTGPPTGTAAPRRTSRRPRPPATTARGWCARRARRRPAGPGCGPGSRAATGGRRGTWCP